MIKSIKPALSVVALSLAMLSQGAVAAEEQFFPFPGYRVGPYGANGACGASDVASGRVGCGCGVSTETVESVW